MILISSLPLSLSEEDSVPRTLLLTIGRSLKSKSKSFSDYGLLSCLALVVFLVLSTTKFLSLRKRRINAPALGPQNWFLSFLGARRWYKNNREMLQEGNKKYKDKTFKIPQYDRWIVVINSPKLLDELRHAPEHIFSFSHGIDDIFAANYTLGKPVVGDYRSVPVLRAQLTRSIRNLFGKVFEEIVNGYDEFIGSKEGEWITSPAMSVVTRVVFRASNRVFVGLPLCQDDAFMEVIIKHTLDVKKVYHTIEYFPVFMKPLVAYLVSGLPKNSREVSKFLGSIIEERLRRIEDTETDWPDKPDDLLQWFIDITKPEERSVMSHIYDFLLVNFSAIFTPSNVMSNALWLLAAHPEYQSKLREEVENIVVADGWSDASIQRMSKVDSFLRETLRYRGSESLLMFRKVLIDYTMSDGTFLPKGTLLAVNPTAVHLNNEIYRDADEFQAFRFVETLEGPWEQGMRNQMVAACNNYLSFGSGRHVCPGRFFAASELKTMLAYVAMNYDLKLPEGQQSLKPLEADLKSSPIMFRRRIFLTFVYMMTKQENIVWGIQYFIKKLY